MRVPQQAVNEVISSFRIFIRCGVWELYTDYIHITTLTLLFIVNTNP